MRYLFKLGVLLLASCFLMTIYVHSQGPEFLGDKNVPEISTNFQLSLKITDGVIS